jgi:peptidyl-prolyl cis-trans isomerase D
MALIGTIRNNTWLLVVLIAVGMGGFILQSIVSGGNQYAAGGQYTLGEINGEKIDYREFQDAESVLYGNSTSNNVYSNKASLWKYFKNKVLAESISKDLGIGVSTEELIELQFGKNLSPIISSRFKNQQTGVVDRKQLDQINQLIQSDELNAEYKRFWAVQEKEIINDRLKTKMSNLVSKAIYAPTWFVEDIYKSDETKSNFNYVKIPFDKINDSDIEVTDSDIQNYISENKSTYTNDEEKRVIKYVIMEVKPSDNDIANIKNNAIQLSKEFGASENDSLFTISNDGIFTNVYYKNEDLPEQIKDDSTLILEKGLVIGPYKDKDVFTIAKILDKKILPDSAKARHILRSVPQEGATPEIFAQVRATIDSIKTILENGTESFDSLAIKLSQDPGSATKGGDLGTFAQGRMVPAFNYACFHGKKGDYQIVTTRFGVHLIEVQEQIFIDNTPKYKVAYITSPIIPSQETQDSLYDVASEILINSTTPEIFEETTSKLNLEIKKSMPLKANDFTFMDLGTDQTSRDIIRWAFEELTEINDLAPTVYTYSNKKYYYNDKYVLTMLSDIFPKGIRSVDDVRKDVEMIVKNKLKGKKIVEMINSSNLEEIAKQFDLKTEMANDIQFKTQFVANLGNEPKLMAYAFNGETGKVSKPIIGNSGVFVISPSLNQAPKENTNLVTQKKAIADKVRGNIPFRLLDEISKNVEFEDNRKKFY